MPNNSSRRCFATRLNSGVRPWLDRMIGIALLVAIALVILLVNVAAIGFGKEQTGTLARAGVVCGWAGIVSLSGLVLAFLDALTQIWVKRPNYEGEPVFLFFYVTLATSVLSLGLATTMILRARRAKA